MKLNLVDNIDDIVNPGDASLYIGLNKRLQLNICCPGCGRVSGSAGAHIFDPVTQSYTPSIIHNKDLGGCGWHGWLTNGEFTEC
jgi:hypothetical protein